MKKKRNIPLTFKQKMFIEEYLRLKGNATQAILNVYNVSTYESANAMGSFYLNNPKIMSQIEKRLTRAKDIIYEIATDEDAKNSDRLKAAQDIIDRTEGKAIQRVESNQTVTVLSEAELED